jgi:antagonist of KipI
MSIEVLKPGALTTLQDLGRRGFQKLGVPVNGVMDERAHRLANALVGNPPHIATLEITLMGPTLRFTVDSFVAVTGADLDVRINGEPLSPNQASSVKGGNEVVFGRRREGVRAYLAVRGGFNVDPVMGSASLFARGGYGGFAGRALAKGDVIHLSTLSNVATPPAYKDLRPVGQDVLDDVCASIRVVAGREWGLFDANSRAAFQEKSFRLTPQSDRMGFRLEGPKLELTRASQMESEALAFGAIQVPADGNPIVLMADRQTTGGYPKIAHVCAVELPRLAQKMPGEFINFKVIDIGEAQRLLLSQERTFVSWEA